LVLLLWRLRLLVKVLLRRRLSLVLLRRRLLVRL